MPATRFAAAALLLNILLIVSAHAAPPGLDKEGKPGLKSAGPLAFGPNGVLFIGDPQSAAIFAVDTGEPGSKGPAATPVNVEGVDAKLAAVVGASADQILINDLAVNPGTGTIYVSMSRGKGNDAQPVIGRIDASGKASELSLDKVAYAEVKLENVPEDKEVEGRNGRKSNPRRESITDIAFFDNRLFVAGLSNEEFASKLRAISFPFSKADAGTSVEVYHGAHGAFETRSPVRTFAPFNINNEPVLLAAYTCTPLVKFPVSKLSPGSKITGTTVAELGNRNQPLDMITYEKDGKTWLLMANSARGVMKISTENIERQEGITERVADKAGQKYDTLAELKDVVQLDKLGDAHAVLLVKAGENYNLKTIGLP